MTGTFTVEDSKPNDQAEIEHLLDLTFGIGRRIKTSYRLREGSAPIAGLSLVIREAGLGVVGAISFWPLAIGGAGTPALLLGPLAVHPQRQNKGIGLALMRNGLTRAKTMNHRLVLLVGDEPYYAKVGFHQLPHGRIGLPGPVNPARFLYLELQPGALKGASGLAQAPLSAAFAVPHGADREQECAEA